MYLIFEKTILSTKPECALRGCDKTATNVYYFQYSRVPHVDHIIPVCTKCKKIILQAQVDNYIPVKPNYKFSLEFIKDKALNILTDEKYWSYRKWLSSYHLLDSESIQKVGVLKGSLLKQISGLTRKHIDSIESLSTERFTGREIEQIKRFIKTREFRLKNKLEKKIQKKL